MIEYTVRAAARPWPGPVRLAVWPSPSHPLFAALNRELGVPLDRQAPGDLGHKMYTALADQTTRGRPAAVLGTDVPQCPPTTLELAYRLLGDGEQILGPTRDGGYYLIGLTHAQPELFAGIAWGSDQVCALTRARAAAAGIRLRSLDTLVDIDTWADLDQVAETFPAAAEWRRQMRCGSSLR